MKTLIALTVFVCLAAASVGQGYQLDATYPTPLRVAAALTTATVQGTSITLPADTRALVLYAQYTKGDSASATITPAVQVDNTTTGTIWSVPGKAWTLTASGTHATRIPAEELPGRFVSLQYVAGTSGNGTSLAVWYKFERPR